MGSAPKAKIFKSSNGKWITKSLFFETDDDFINHAFVSYTLKDEDHRGYPSLYKLYMSCSDPTEYQFAEEHLGGWSHWETLCACSWFKDYVARWRKELELKIRSEALREVSRIASEKTHKSSYEANKYLLNGSWKNKEETKRGRPTKDEVKAEATRIAEDEQRLAQDAQLIGTLN